MDNEINIDINSDEILPKSAKDFRCSPTVIFENGSCISVETLLKMAESYNEKFPDKIKLSKSLETLNPDKYKRYLVREFKNRFDKSCNDQKCWIKKVFYDDTGVKDTIIEKSFRPKGPEGKFEWLNTLNINDVMRQYEHKYPDFKYLGTVPVDFEEISEMGFKDLDLGKLYDSGKVKIGMVINLDEHDKGGSHWVGLFSDMKEGNVYFFDSYGVKPERRIRKFMRKIANFVEEKHKKKAVVDYNNVRNQFGGNACGVYSLSFILRMLRDGSFSEILKNPIKDREINKCREYYFS